MSVARAAGGMKDRPVWIRCVTGVERRLAPYLDHLVQTSEFARGSALVMATQRRIQERLAGVSAGFWHLLNLPAATDLARLRRQVGALDHDLRRLSIDLEQQRG